MRWRRVGLGCWGAMFLLAATVGPSPAAETLLEDLSGSVRYALQWPGARLTAGEGGGMHWLRVTTEGGGGTPANALLSNVHPIHPTLDLSGKFLKVWVRVGSMGSLGGIELRLSSDGFGDDYFAFPFPLYSDLDANVLREGIWTPVTLPFGAARVVGAPDRSAIDSIGWFLKDDGSAPVSMEWGGLAAVDEPAQGVVTLTFDDGYDEHHLAARLMAEHGFRGTAFVIPNAVGTAGYMTLHDLVELDEHFRWEIAAHHENPFTDLTRGDLETTILGIQRFLMRNGFVRGARHLAYPLGKQDSQTVRPVVRKYFATARIAGGGIETLPPADRHLLRVRNVTKDTTPEELGMAARLAKRDKQWLILMFHFLVEQPKTLTDYALDDFRSALREIAEAQVAVAPLGEVWEACGMLDSPCRLAPVAAPAR